MAKRIVIVVGMALLLAGCYMRGGGVSFGMGMGGFGCCGGGSGIWFGGPMIGFGGGPGYGPVYAPTQPPLDPNTPDGIAAGVLGRDLVGTARFVDLAEAGARAVIVATRGPGCDDQGCLHYVLMEREGAWQPVGDIQADSLEPGDKVTRGMRDLKARGPAGETVLRWDGSAYVREEA